MNEYNEFAGKLDYDKTIRDLDKLYKIIEEVFVTDEGSYKGLNEYNTAKFSYVHGRLRWHKFSPNQPKKNTIELNPNGVFWKNVYDKICHTLEIGGLQPDAHTVDRQKVDLNIISDIKASLLLIKEGILV